MLQQNCDQNIGVLFKESVNDENLRFTPGSDLGDALRRRALVADVTIGRFDFTLFAVQLKSGRGDPKQKIHDEQCKVIGALIIEMREHSCEGILLMGDFNMIPR